MSERCAVHIKLGSPLPSFLRALGVLWPMNESYQNVYVHSMKTLILSRGFVCLQGPSEHYRLIRVMTLVHRCTEILGYFKGKEKAPHVCVPSCKMSCAWKHLQRSMESGSQG